MKYLLIIICAAIALWIFQPLIPFISSSFKSIQKTSRLKRIAIIGSIIIAAFWLAGKISDSTPNASKDLDSSQAKYCSKHGVMYDPNNAWKGCPKCKDEENQKAMQKSIDKARKL